jgi:hypothetical protein
VRSIQQNGTPTRAGRIDKKNNRLEEMKILKLDPWRLFGILFLIPVFQLITGFGIFLGNFVLGIYPFALFYFIWLLLLQIEFEKKFSPYVIKFLNTGLIKMLLWVTILLVIPFHWVYAQFVYRENVPIILMLLGGILFMVWVYALFSSWATLSKCIFILNENNSYKVKFHQYRKIFILFLLGPITIWLLQPKIIQALTTDKVIK